MEYGEGSRGRRFLAHEQKAEPKRVNPLNVALATLCNLITIGLIIWLVLWYLGGVLN